MKLYGYGMRLRGFSPGCQPKEGFVECRDSNEYHDIIVYKRKLTADEVSEYELDFLGTEDAFERTNKEAVNDRFENLKAMNTIIKSVNDEQAYGCWINIVPDEADDDELREIAEDLPECYANACGLFLRLMKSSVTQDGGLYIGGDLYTKED